jgi:hypothetical protein
MRVNAIYRFNDVRAEVVSVSDEEVRWRHPDATRPKTHKVPRWFFEKHSTFERWAGTHQ